jgi:peptidylprolyl isomerase
LPPEQQAAAPPPRAEPGQTSWFEWRPWRKAGTASQSLPTTSQSDIANANFLVMETSKGKVLIKLRPDLAPKHVERVRLLVADGFYSGVKFHRVIPGFMAQTGDPTGTGMGRSQYPDLAAEFSAEPFTRGTVAAAREAPPDTANSQFFICFTDESCGLLTGQYTIWGNVVEGMDAIDQLAAGEPPADADYVRSIVLQSGTDPAPSPAAPSPSPAPAISVAPPAPAAPVSDLPAATPESPVAAGQPPIPLGCPIDQDFGGWTVRRGSLQGVPVVTTGNHAGYSGTATKWSMDALSIELMPTKQGKWHYFMFAKNLKYAGAPVTQITGHFGASIWDGATKQGFSGFENKSGGGTVYQAPYVVIGLPPFYIDEAIDKIESLQSVNFSLVMPTEAGKMTDVYWINPFRSDGLRAAMAAAQACAVE